MRGYKNLNPGNLIKGGFLFVGEKSDSTDTRFRQFISMAFGFRAMIKVLLNYIKRGSDTLEEMINIYAPPSENDTRKYIEFVSRATGIDPNEPIKASDKDKLIKIVRSMATLENGAAPNDQDIIRGWDLLSVNKVPTDPGSVPSTSANGDKKKTNNIPELITALGLIGTGLIIFSYAKR